jgi:hypothetical protein
MLQLPKRLLSESANWRCRPQAVFQLLSFDPKADLGERTVSSSI